MNSHFQYHLKSVAHAIAIFNFFKGIGYSIDLETGRSIESLAEKYMKEFPYLHIDTTNRKIGANDTYTKLSPYFENDWNTRIPMVDISFEDIFELNNTRCYRSVATEVITGMDCEISVNETHVDIGKYKFPIELIQKLVDLKSRLK